MPVFLNKETGMQLGINHGEICGERGSWFQPWGTTVCNARRSVRKTIKPARHCLLSRHSNCPELSGAPYIWLIDVGPGPITIHPEMPRRQWELEDNLAQHQLECF